MGTFWHNHYQNPLSERGFLSVITYTWRGASKNTKGPCLIHVWVPNLTKILFPAENPRKTLPGCHKGCPQGVSNVECGLLPITNGMTRTRLIVQPMRLLSSGSIEDHEAFSNGVRSRGRNLSLRPLVYLPLRQTWSRDSMDMEDLLSCS